MDKFDRKVMQAFKRIGRNPHLFALIVIKTVVNVGILLFINQNNATVLIIVATVIMLAIFNLFLNKESSKKTYNIKNGVFGMKVV